MAKKSKGFRDLLKQKRAKINTQQKSLDRFEKQFRRRGIGGQFAEIVQNPQGEIKMSDMFEALVEPYLESTESFEEQEILFQIGLVAWNLAMMPEHKRQVLADDFMGKVMRITDPVVEQEVRELLGELIERKLEHFSEVDRHIVDFKLEDNGDEYHLSVASTPSKSRNI